MTLKKSRYFFEGDDLTEYASVIQERLQNTTVSDMTMIGPII